MREDASTRVGFDRDVVASLAASLRSNIAKRRGPWLVGVSGLQGSGKTTLSRQLARALSGSGVPTQVLSLDDFYLGRRARRRLAREVHPLLSVRGVPGTHDLDLLQDILARLRDTRARETVRTPRFDKGRDTRVPPSRWPAATDHPQCILLEGWCVGVPAQPASALIEPVNTLERTADRDAQWRGWVNAKLAGDYAALWNQQQALIVLQAPGFDVVVGWRNEQERVLRKRAAPRAMTASAISRFVQNYERISRHALEVLPTRADYLLRLDRRRRVIDLA